MYISIKLDNVENCCKDNLFSRCHQIFVQFLLHPPNGKSSVYDAHLADLLNELPIPLRSIVRLAKHLAVGDVCSTTFTPCGDVVGIHFIEFPNAGA